MPNLVAIVGRPNVGKSTLFNRLTKTRQAIVSDTAGTTRDRQYGKCEWNGREFSVVDTGGWVVKSDDIFEDAIRKQVIVATEEADLVLFLVDVQTGLTDWDEDVAQILRRTKLPVILVANKTDNNDQIYDAAEFYALGLGEPQCISSATGSGTGDLLDLVLSKMPSDKGETVEDGIPRFAVVGRPNAGKSSIINAFIGEERNIVTEIAGTTRDSIYTRFDKFGFDFYLVDTAGIRRKNKVSEDLEFYSVMRSIRAIENSDVCILMIDATRGIEAQDMNIFQLIQRNNKSLVVVVNKMGPRGEQGPGGDKDIRERHTPTHGSVRGLPHHLRFSNNETAHLQGARNSQAGISEPQGTHRNIKAQRGDAAAHRGLSATINKGKVHQNQILHTASQHADTVVRVLRQPAAVCERALPPFPRKQDKGQLGTARMPDKHLHPSEIKKEHNIRVCKNGIDFFGTLIKIRFTHPFS